MTTQIPSSGPSMTQFVISTDAGKQTLLRVASLSCGAVRVTRTQRESFLPDPSMAVIHRDPGTCTVTETENGFLADCGGAKVQISKDTGALTFLDQENRMLLRENTKRPCQMAEKPVMVNRFRQDADDTGASSEDYETVQDRMAYACRLSFDFDPDEGLYGLGSHEEGYGNLRGKSRDLYQHNMKAVVPVLVSTKGWGLLFDMGCFMTFHDDAYGSYLWADCADEMDYYFMAGGYAAVCRQYRCLTGAAPLLPRYAFGYIQSKERYKDAEELLSVAKEYRRRQVPLDLIVQDWQTWPEGQWGYKVFDRQRYPDPQALTDALHEMGVKMMISVWPSMHGDENENRKEMLENGCMLGNRAVYNAFDPKARLIYWKQAQEGLFRYGIDAWWCDCTEPFEPDWQGEMKPEPFERVHLNTEEAKKYLDPAKISLYSLHHSMGIFEGQRSAAPGKRVLNLTRSSWAGQHRYATVTWSGDVSSTWETLRRQVPEGLNFMATGEGWWSTDAGGFFPCGLGGPWVGAGDFPEGVNDPGYRELYVRWLQFSVFLPIMRSHGMSTPREIWQFGEKGGKWYDAIEKIIHLRMRLLPHLYSLAAQYSREGLPMTRVPALAFPDDPILRTINDEMLLGDSLLIKPVTHPMEYLPNAQKIEQPDDTETVYLPAGCDWYAWETGEKYMGGQTVQIHAPLDQIPVFLRSGAILLTYPVQQYTGEIPSPPLTVTVYPGADGSFTWYDDPGDGNDPDACALVDFVWHDTAGELTVSARQGRFPGMAETQEIHIRLLNREEQVVVYTGDALCLNLKQR
ncbi:MAG: DUF5110 domain-containing protein [Clostridia bacterium]|nr:DUF5110 domain-containing protein [Clostridia bacterium]